MSKTPARQLSDANDPRYPFAVWCADCLGPVTRGGRRLEDGTSETIKKCIPCDNDSRFLSDRHRRAIERKQEREGAEVFDSLPPEFRALYTEKGKAVAEL